MLCPDLALSSLRSTEHGETESYEGLETEENVSPLCAVSDKQV